MMSVTGPAQNGEELAAVTDMTNVFSDLIELHGIMSATNMYSGKVPQIRTPDSYF